MNLQIIDVFVFIAGFFAVLTASIVAFHPNILYAAIALTGTLLSVAGLYGALGADFVAAAQLIIYVGGIIVVILFAIMMSENVYRTRFLDNARRYLGPIVCGVVLFTVLMKLISKAGIVMVEKPIRIPSSESIGNALINAYALPFEYTAIFLLVGLIGAVIVARPDYKEKHIRTED